MARFVKTKRSTALAKLIRDDKGATLMEYVMLAGLIAIAAFAGFKLFGSNISSTINGQAGAVSSIPDKVTP
jgi:pilus assembly protein Flp/PilA